MTHPYATRKSQDSLSLPKPPERQICTPSGCTEDPSVKKLIKAHTSTVNRIAEKFSTTSVSTDGFSRLIDKALMSYEESQGITVPSQYNWESLQQSAFCLTDGTMFFSYALVRYCHVSTPTTFNSLAAPPFNHYSDHPLLYTLEATFSSSSSSLYSAIARPVFSYGAYQVAVDQLDTVSTSNAFSIHSLTQLPLVLQEGIRFCCSRYGYRVNYLTNFARPGASNDSLLSMKLSYEKLDNSQTAIRIETDFHDPISFICKLCPLSRFLQFGELYIGDELLQKGYL